MALCLRLRARPSYWLITHILVDTYSVSRDDDLLGGMWSVVATVFVYRVSHAESVRAALSRMAATSVSFALCLAYLSIFPFHAWGMAALIGIGAIVVTLLRRPDDTITTGITTAVVMVVAALSPHHAWRQPVLRVVDTTVGVAGGLARQLVPCIPESAQRVVNFTPGRRREQALADTPITALPRASHFVR